MIKNLFHIIVFIFLFSSLQINIFSLDNLSNDEIRNLYSNSDSSSNSNIEDRLSDRDIAKLKRDMRIFLKDELPDVLEDANSIANSSEQIVKDAQSKLTKMERDRREALANSIKDQNTLLFTVPKASFLGFYKGDLVSIAVYLGELLNQNIFLKQFLENKAEYIYESLLENSDELEEILTKLITNKDSFKSDLNAKKDLINLLQKFIDTNHKYIYKNPFKSDLFWPIIKENLLKFGIDSAEDQFLVKDYSFSESYNAYKKSGSDFEKLKKSPISIVLPIKDFKLFRFIINSEQSSQILHKLLGITLPNFVYSKKFKVIENFVSLGLSIRSFNSIYHNMWFDYVIKNKIDLLIKLKKLKLSRSIDDKEAAQLKLKNFIKKAFPNVSLFSFKHFYNWSNIKQISKNRISSLTSLPVMGLIAWKAWNFYKENLAQN